MIRKKKKNLSFIFVAPLLLLLLHPTPLVYAQKTHSPLVYVQIMENASIRCDEAFDPPTLRIPQGTTVVWKNQDHVTHTLVSATSNGPCRPIPLGFRDRAIDGGQLFQGMTFKQTFNTPGTYLYMCHLPEHRMQGKIIVEPK